MSGMEFLIGMLLLTSLSQSQQLRKLEKQIKEIQNASKNK